MRTNTTKTKLNEGEVVFGAIITRYAPDMVEIFWRPRLRLRDDRLRTRAGQPGSGEAHGPRRP